MFLFYLSIYVFTAGGGFGVGELEIDSFRMDIFLAILPITPDPS